MNDEDDDGADDATDIDGDDDVDSGEVRAKKPNMLAMLGARVAT